MVSQLLNHFLNRTCTLPHTVSLKYLLNFVLGIRQSLHRTLSGSANILSSRFLSFLLLQLLFLLPIFFFQLFPNLSFLIPG